MFNRDTELLEHESPTRSLAILRCGVSRVGGLAILGDTKMARQISVYPGDEFNYLTVIEESDRVVISGKPCRHFKCKCVCGKILVVRFSQMRASTVKSCGCMRKQLLTKHGHWNGGEKTLTYKSWLTMRSRCLNENAKSYDRYGGRGISICDRWWEFSAFLEDMGERPSVRHSIDRIDPNGDYSPDNCRWATPKQQGRNRRNNRLLTYNGETRCIAEWAERIGMSKEALTCRLDICHYTIEEAITLPIGVKRDRV